jgi:hypothetical protein
MNREKGADSMTSAERVLKHFHDRPAGEMMDWIIERFHASAREFRAISIEIPHDEPPRVEANSDGQVAFDTSRAALRPFRTLLARMAKMGADESSAEFQPFGGHVVFHRGGVRIDWDFENTTANQRFSMVAISAAPLPNLGSETRDPIVSGAG